MVWVFDVGGTLMEYRGMPYSWVEFYLPCFKMVRESLGLELTDLQLETSADIMKGLNPRVNYREVELSPKYIFGKATKEWTCEFSLDEVIANFFSHLKLEGYIYPETVEVLERLRGEGHRIAVLTDTASGMPDDLHKSYFSQLLPMFDLYVSSISCGYRKPNPKGLEDIAEFFGVEISELIMIGDEEKDILAAKNAGCRAVLVDRENKGLSFGQDFTCYDLNGVLEIL